MNIDLKPTRLEKINKLFPVQIKKKIVQREKIVANVEKHPLLEKPSPDLVFHWIAPEFERHHASQKIYAAIGVSLLLTITYAVFTNSSLMAITFILFAVVGYMKTQQKPKLINFFITLDGVIIEKEIYEYEKIESFWIFYDPPYTKILSLKVKSSVFPHVHIPLDKADPVKIREELLKFLPEEKQEQSLIDIIDRVVHI